VTSTWVASIEGPPIKKGTGLQVRTKAGGPAFYVYVNSVPGEDDLPKEGSSYLVSASDYGGHSQVGLAHKTLVQEPIKRLNRVRR